MRSPWHDGPRRRALWIGLILLVLAAHVGFGWEVAGDVIGWEAGAAEPPAIEVDLVRELAPSAPPVVAAAAPPEPVARLAVPARRAASAASEPEEAASAPVPAPEPAASAVEAAEAAASAPPVAVAAASAPEPAASSSPPPSPASAPIVASAASGAASSALLSGTGAFEWPPSTRLTYTVTGNYRGELHGSAKVEWRRDGGHYQVEVDTEVGFIITDHAVSDGHIGADGLVPDAWQEQRHVPFLKDQRYALRFGPGYVELTNGQQVPRPERLQDTASQFVQFVYLFALHPEWLKPGQVVDMPLALPRRVGTWSYDVHEPETLYLPFGTIDAVHLTPRPGVVRANEIAVELWIAPTLQYLPVKVRFSQREYEAFLSLDARPLQAAPAASAAASVPPSRSR